MPAPNGYTVAADGQLTVPNSGGVIGYVASACKTEVLLQSAAGPGLGTTECQGASTPANETLTVTKAGTGTGTVTSAPAGINCGATCAAPFASGTQVTLTAAPATGSTFTGWDAPCSGTGNCIVTLTAATTVTATFTPSANNFTLTVTKAGTGTGTVTSAPAGINCGATCAAPFASGTQVTLTAVPTAGSTFAGWGAPCQGTGTCVITIAAATAVTATFTLSTTNFALTVTEAGTGTGTVTSTPAGIACQPTCIANFASGQVVALSATAAAGSTFAGWSGAGCSGTAGCSVTMTAAQAVQATFTKSATNVALTVTEAGTGTGTVTSTPAGIACQPTCVANFASGQVVALSATAAAGSTFAGWSGAGCSGTAGCSVTMTAAQAVQATFTKSATNVALTVTEAGTGPGTVTSTPAGIACQPTCIANFASGQVVALSATAAAGSTFAGWSGAGCSGTAGCSVTMTAAQAVQATFTKSATNVALTVTEAGTGTGTVTSTPAGIACQPTCIANFASGQVVALSATAAAGSTFAGWSGAGCSGTAGCSVTMTAAQAVQATFNKSATNVALTVTEAGTGTGTVTSAPAGIACQPTCVANFASGQVVALTATAAAGSTFAGWTGAGPCEGTEVCMFDITVATSVTANFTKNVTNVTLTVAETGTGTGTVTSAPAGIACQPTCSASFASGQAVALTATAAAGSTFAGWSGAGCSGTAGCSVTLTAATTVTAMFNKSTTNFMLTVTEAGSGTGTVTSAPTGIACQPMCSASFASGQVVAWTATAAEGSTFGGWSGGG